MTVTQVNGHAAPGSTPDVLLAEKAVLGSAIGSRVIAESVTEMLPADDCFTDGMHQAVSAAIRYLAECGGTVDPPSVLARLVAAEHGVWQTGQAGVILSELLDHATPAWEEHASAVLTAAIRRRGMLALRRAHQLLGERDLSTYGLDETAAEIRALVDEAFATAGGSDGTVTASGLFDSAIERLESGRPPGVIQFPYADLREIVPYLRPGQLVTIAARPSLGKSLLGQDLARHVAIHDRIPAILFTMEQDRDEVMDRILAAESGVALASITDGPLTEDDWTRLAGSASAFAESKLTIDDAPSISLSHIRARLRGMSREPAQVAIIDYLQLMEGAGGESRQREVSALVAGLKAVAREFRIPVVMLCQLNRGPESRHDKRPYLSDARESGAVENDSDVAILIHRPDHYERESLRAGEADLIVDKNRNGRRATVTVAFQGYNARFTDLSRQQPPPPPVAPWAGDA